MNNVLSEILETGSTKLASGSGVTKVHSAVPVSEGQFLQRIIKDLDPTVSLEVGLAFGVSALFICDALTIRNGTQHIVIDPLQSDSWGGIGIANLRRAGYGPIVHLIEAPSYRALPELEKLGQRVDFAFIDGWHTFDFTFVDFFFIDRILNIGGVVAFDDADWPAIRKVCRFVKTNLAYSVLGIDGTDAAPSLKRRVFQDMVRYTPLVRRRLSKILHSEVVMPNKSVGLDGRCIAFRKDATDDRRWDHFIDF